MNPRLSGLLSWLVTLLTPITVVLLIARLMLSPLLPRLEYRMPGFPADPYGFTQSDRVEWSGYAWQYALNSAGIDFLANMKFSDGSPVFNERELSHMHDVKGVVQGVLKVLYVSLAVLIGLGVYAWLGGWKRDFLAGISRGGWLTVGLILGISALALVSFWDFFTLLHEMFFKGDTWLFEYSDTLIRLFPIRFWQDIFLFGLGLALITGALLGVLARPRRRSPETGKV
jgi:integral membrane protein (TIGR01906 family)